jgi:hypothetical protein
MAISQLLDTENGPKLFFSKKYIKENHIKELNFDEYYIEHKEERHISNYKFEFDTSGVAIKKIITGILSDSTDCMIDLGELMYSSDDSVFYDSKNNSIKTYFYGAKDYYTYDSLNRLIKHVSNNQQMQEETYVYDNNMILYQYKKSFKVCCDGQHQILAMNTHKLCYENELLHYIESMTFNGVAYKSVIEYELEYKTNTVFQIKQQNTPKGWHTLLIKVEKSK